jgi:hypothetical protein
MRKRTPFSREFKLEALRLLEEGKKPVADLARANRQGVTLNLPQFDGHFKKDTIEVEGVSNEKKNTV